MTEHGLSLLDPDLWASLAALVAAITAMVKVLWDARKQKVENTRLNRRIEILEAEKVQREQDYREIIRQLAEAQRMVIDLSRSYDALKLAYESLKTNYDELRSKYDLLLAENLTLKQQMAQVKKQTGPLQDGAK